MSHAHFRPNAEGTGNSGDLDNAQFILNSYKKMRWGTSSQDTCTGALTGSPGLATTWTNMQCWVFTKAEQTFSVKWKLTLPIQFYWTYPIIFIILL